MNRYFLHLSYNGSRYRGWQSQANVVSVQETLKKAICTLIRKKVKIMGCGRTDALVHASQYFLHFNFEEDLDQEFVYKINRLLPKDISVYEVIKVDRNAHVQRDVSSRTYQFYIHRKKNPFIEKISSFYPEEAAAWDIEKMKTAAGIIKLQKDFRSLCRQPDTYPSTICEVSKLSIEHDELAQHMCVTITANRFLRAMVRLIVQHLIDVGRGDLSMSELKSSLKTGVRAETFLAAFPQGLYLSEVIYPYLYRAPLQQKSFNLMT